MAGSYGDDPMMHFAGAIAPSSVPMPSRLNGYLTSRSFDKPTLVIDVERVAAQFRALQSGLGRAQIHYAVKANPAPEVIARLVALGSHFDAASKGEIALCLNEGAAPSDISFGNTVKRASDIAWAHGHFRANSAATATQHCAFWATPNPLA